MIIAEMTGQKPLSRAVISMELPDHLKAFGAIFKSREKNFPRRAGT